MNLREACLLSYKVMKDYGVVEAILMSDPPNNEASYVVQVRTKSDPPRVEWLGPIKADGYAKIKATED